MSKRFDISYFEKGNDQENNVIIFANTKEEALLELNLPENYYVESIDELSPTSVRFY